MKKVQVIVVLAMIALISAVSTSQVAASERSATASASTALFAADAGGDKSTAFIDLPRRWDLSIYTIVVFLLLFGLLKVFAWPHIAAGLQKREETLAAAKEAAIRAKAEADAATAKLAAEFAQANDKIRAMLEEARRDADALRAKEREQGQREAASERDRAKREIEAARDAALQEIYMMSVDLATMISTKAIRRTMSPDDHNRLVNEALEDLKSSPRG